MEGWLFKQSGGSKEGSGRRRRSVGELLTKWDERYFVLTINNLYYFKTEQDFKAGEDAKGSLSIKNNAVSQGEQDELFIMAGKERIMSLKAADRAQRDRWVTAIRAVQLSWLSTANTKELRSWAGTAGIPAAATSFFMEESLSGNAFCKVKGASDLEAMGYSGPADKITAALSGLRGEATVDWLERFVTFMQSQSQTRSLEPEEVASLSRIGKGMEVITAMRGGGEPDEEPEAEPAAEAPAADDGAADALAQMAALEVPDGDDDDDEDED